MKLTRNTTYIVAAIVLACTIAFCVQTYYTQKSKKFKAIIFDMDGTIIDTDHLWKCSNRFILDTKAVHLSHEEKDAMIESFKHLTFYEIWKMIQEDCAPDMSIEEIAQENRRQVQIMYQEKGISFIPNFCQFYKQLANTGLKTAIATSSEADTVNIILDIVPLKEYFSEHIYHVDHVNKAYKPSPAVYLHAANMLNLDPSACIAIEDSSSGVKAAKSAGMYCIGINTGKNRDLLKQADEIVDCYTEIDLTKLLSL